MSADPSSSCCRAFPQNWHIEKGLRPGSRPHTGHFMLPAKAGGYFTGSGGCPKVAERTGVTSFSSGRAPPFRRRAGHIVPSPRLLLSLLGGSRVSPLSFSSALRGASPRERKRMCKNAESKKQMLNEIFERIGKESGVRTMRSSPPSAT